ncbi:hypothetical protein RFI_35665 [Reticulomyxa filosa]|uniref:Uncharacterized protein n=1 Tax=Reticulomyxa filosa TaxID=46433 RepID=X6LJH7_RETFI|nr:hypothetical protein RFI_35665 [Reticulomyxa filosa]|eukprot:ETO01774.1 hypothetical protein RFI_35665 [Reticulomyxa filosa]
MTNFFLNIFFSCEQVNKKNEFFFSLYVFCFMEFLFQKTEENMNKIAALQTQTFIETNIIDYIYLSLKKNKKEIIYRAYLETELGLEMWNMYLL